MKERLEIQLEYAQQQHLTETNVAEKLKWEGYIQGLRFSLANIEIKTTSI